MPRIIFSLSKDTLPDNIDELNFCMNCSNSIVTKNHKTVYFCWKFNRYRYDVDNACDFYKLQKFPL